MYVQLYDIVVLYELCICTVMKIVAGGGGVGIFYHRWDGVASGCCITTGTKLSHVTDVFGKISKNVIIYKGEIPPNPPLRACSPRDPPQSPELAFATSALVRVSTGSI